MGPRGSGNWPQPLKSNLVEHLELQKTPISPMGLWFIAQILNLWSISPTTPVSLNDNKFLKLLPSYQTPSTMCLVYYTGSDCDHVEAFYIRCGKYPNSNRYFNQPANQKVIHMCRSVVLEELMFVSAQPTSVSI